MVTPHPPAEGVTTVSRKTTYEEMRVKLPDETAWPRPSYALRLSRKARYNPDTLTQGEMCELAQLASIYATMIRVPAMAKKLPAVRRALRESPLPNPPAEVSREQDHSRTG